MNSFVNHLGNGENKVHTHALCPLLHHWHQDWLNLKTLSKFSMIHRRWPHPNTTGSGYPDILFSGIVSPSLLPRSYFCSLGFIFPSILCEEEKKKPSSSPLCPHFFSQVQLATAGELIIASIEIIISLNPSLEQLPASAAAALIAGAGTSCPSNIQTLLGPFWETCTVNISHVFLLKTCSHTVF